MFEVRRISAADARPLRQAVLRPHQAVSEVVFPGDEEPDTRHFGVVADGGAGEIVAVATVVREPRPGTDDPDAWRVRGMATVEGLRGKGCGQALLIACIGCIASAGGSIVWCNARTPAVGFYEKYGFEKVGEEFEVPRIGPHVVMVGELG